ncbi:MAG TPA: sugar transferase [Chthonomonadaceae bacterium]|nr:sugar transferase [Chthonomonadaceae bacterium]
METVRDTDASSLRTAPNRDVPIPTNTDGNGLGQAADGSQNGASRRYAVVVEGAHTANGHAAHRLAFSANSHRFALNYRDPLFPCKSVPYAHLKRGLDIVAALLILFFSLPIMLVVALLVKLTSRGPILFKQVRVGRGGRYFWCYKFRSMCADAEAQKERLAHLNEASGPVFKIKDDPRVTPIGRFLRKYSLDELPQLINVLRGDMSLVGPRPPIPCEVEAYGPRERARLSVQPGLTCLWQVSGRSNISFEHWIELDLLYIDTMSFANDLKIILRTIPAVLSGAGAH